MIEQLEKDLTKFEAHSIETAQTLLNYAHNRAIPVELYGDDGTGFDASLHKPRGVNVCILYSRHIDELVARPNWLKSEFGIVLTHLSKEGLMEVMIRSLNSLLTLDDKEPISSYGYVSPEREKAAL